MGPTASGKTDLAMALSDRIRTQLISVDSALVYQNMDIGTAKPNRDELSRYPHALIDICDPVEPYSVAEFCRDAKQAIDQAVSEGKIPILVGGTMMYFKALMEGLAEMPETDPKVRDEVTREAEQLGWPEMHRQLAVIDPEYAAQLHPNHSQRISRALEVYRMSGKTMTQHRTEQHNNHGEDNVFEREYRLLQFGLIPEDRAWLHQRIAQRFERMLEQGFIDEVQALRQRGDLHLDLPSMRSVGYRQVWQCLDGEYDKNTMLEKGIIATRQLAKRQLTWLRGWPNLVTISVSENKKTHTIEKMLNLS